MKTRAQHDQTRLLRRLGYWTVAIALLPVQLQAPSGYALLGLGFLLCWPLIFEGLQPQAEPWLALLEGALVSTVIIGLQVGAAVAGGVLLIYLLCQWAYGGLHRLRLALIAVAASVVLAGFARPLVLTQASASVLHWPDARELAVVIVTLLFVFMACAFTHIGYERSVRLHRAKQALQLRSQQLQQVNQRLARYLPAELPARVQGAPQQRLSLQRRWLTVVFVDLCDFSACTRALEAEALAVVLDDYLTLLAQECEQAGGSLSKVVGDGALVIFESNQQTAQRVVARRAVALCEALPVGLAALHARWQAQGLLPALRIRAGIASGYCSMGDWGQQRLDYTVIGDAVNLCARLQQQADPGAVWLDDASAVLVAEQVLLSPPQALLLKGFGTRLAHPLLSATLVDRAKGSAMVPTVSAAPAANPAAGPAASERHHDHEQTISAGLSGRTH